MALRANPPEIDLKQRIQISAQLCYTQHVFPLLV